MKYAATLLILVFVFVGSVPETALADDVPNGLGGSLFLGGNFCIPNGKASCDNIDPGFGMSLTALYRIIDYIAIDFTFFYGMYDTIENVDTNRLGVLGGLRLYLPVSNVDLFAEIGIGWAQLKVEGGGDKATLSGFAMGFGLGADYRITKWFALGLLLRYHLPFYNKVCLYMDGRSECDTIPDDGDIAHGLMAGLNVSFYLP